jgi:hypothetical protein
MTAVLLPAATMIAPIGPFAVLLPALAAAR